MASSRSSFIESVNRSMEMLDIRVETEMISQRIFILYMGKYAEPVADDFTVGKYPQNAICEAIDRLRSRLAGAYAL